MSDGDLEPKQARGYSWAPFAPGHELSIRSGAWSARKLLPVAEQFVEAITTDADVAYLRASRYRAAVQAWATAEARVVLLEEWVDAMPIDKAATAPAGRTPPLEILRKWEATAMTHRDRLGLTPMAAARLGKDVAQGRQADAATELTRMREEYEREMRARRGEVVDGD